MVSSLAAQLAQGASLNASLLVDRSRRKPTESYLFLAKEAQQHDIDAIYALGTNGFLQLKSLDPSFQNFEGPLFSDAAKVTDRTILSKDANAELDRQISTFLPLLGPYLMDAPTGKVLEWLLRRFRINEFNVHDVMRLFMPYHESPHFAKMVTLLHFSDESTFHFLLAYKKTGLPLPREALVTEMLNNSDLSRFVSDLLPNALKQGGAGAHKALVIFHTGVLLDFVARSQELDEGTTAFLLSAAVEPVQLDAEVAIKAKSAILQESILGSLLILAAISQKCQFTPKALKTIMNALASCAERVSTRQFIRTLLCICSAQNKLPKFPRALIGSISKLSGVDVELKEALVWVGAEAVIDPLVAGLISQLAKERNVTLLESIIGYKEIPSDSIHHAATSLLQELIEAEDQTEKSVIAAQQLLLRLQQRHAAILEQVCKNAAQDESKRDAIKQVIGSLSLALPGFTGSNDSQRPDAIVASVSADPDVRAGAVRDLFNAWVERDTSVADIDSLKTALRMRVQDTEALVIETLYARPTELVPLLLEDAVDFITSLVHILHDSSSPASRNLVRLHLSFLANHFFSPLREQDPSLAESIIHRLFFPYLLFSKPRQKTATVVWEILEANEADRDDYRGIGKSELLGGCVDAVRWERSRQATGDEEDDSYRVVETLTKINMAVAARMADNILTSNEYSHHFEALLEKLQDSNIHSRDLGYLVIRALLSRLSGKRQIDAAHRMLCAMKLDSLEGMGDFLRGVDNLADFLHDMSIGTAVVLKPSSRHTTHRLQIALLATLPIMPRPTVLTLDWLSSPSPISATDHDNDGWGIHYVELMRIVYKLSNSSSSLPLLSAHLLRALFINLGADTLAFLAGIWLCPPGRERNEEKHHIRLAALRHASAFLEADLSLGRRLDFQTILPAVLIATQSPDARVREAATMCINVLLKMSHSKDGVSAVYAFDTLYGTKSSVLQYLEWADFCKYIGALGAVQSHILHDPGYIRIFHQGHLALNKSDSKKQAGYKQRIMCYLLSHVNACQLLDFKTDLLKTLETTTNEVKCTMLIPSIQLSIDEGLPLDTDLFTLLVSCFDASSAAELSDTDKSSWSVYENTLRKCFVNNLDRAKSILSDHIKGGLFAKLSMQRQLDLCFILLDLGVQDVNTASECKQLLGNILVGVDLMKSLLVTLQPNPLEAAERAPKRARLENATDSLVDNKLSTLSLLAEVLASRALPGSLDLIVCLLETLSKVTHDVSAAPADKSYVEQLLMTAIENAVNSVSDASIISPGAIRVDVLVELIRAVENPQTFHQALLLLAALARLAPDAVLHNVMPVFTFMGSNVFHRDDTYSFRVVQKTIENIVPVMVASLRTTHSTRLSLYIGSRDFLRIFTDASNHIPRHRRAKFFSHLVDVLGVDEFLAPVSMLLVDKVANRVVRQNAQDARGSLSLPLTAFQHYSTQQHVTLLMEVLREVQRLLRRRMNDTNAQECFLASPTDDDQNTQSSALWRRRSLALLIFCDFVLKDLAISVSSKEYHDRTSSSELLSLLLSIVVAKDEDISRTDIAAAARVALNDTLRIMSASDFVSGVLTMLRSEDAEVQIGALGLLGERLPTVADRARRELTAVIVEIVSTIRTILLAKPEQPVMRAAFHAIRAICQTVCTGEENVLTTTVPLVLEAVHTAPSAFLVLLSLCSKLGPRIIPYFKRIVQECVLFIRQQTAAVGDGDNSLIEAINVIQNLLTSIPTFWGESELIQVIDMCLQTGATTAKAESSVLTPLMKTMTKRIPSKVLLPTLAKVWSSMRPSGKSSNSFTYIAYFTLMKRSLRAAGRPIVLEHLRELYKIFQDAFELSAMDEEKELERELIPSFLELVVKLNETAFRPLFRRLSDWAFANENTGSSHARTVTFCHIYIALLDYFKALMVPYMSLVWQAFLKMLDDYTKGAIEDQKPWISVLETLTKTLAFDESGFWRSDKLQQLVPALIMQIRACIELQFGDGKTALSDCLVATMEAVSDDALLKSMNMDILMHTRSEDARLRLYSLACSEALWRAHGGKLLGFVAETATFIAECAEDDNDNVVRQAHNLKDAVESVAGNIDVM